MDITTKQIKIIHALLPDRIKNDKELKEAIIIEYTGDYTKHSTKDLTFNQANQMILNLGGKPAQNEWSNFDASKASHRYILSLLYQGGWVTWSLEQNKYIADMTRFGNWLNSIKSPVKKPLNGQNKTETSKTITALEGMMAFELKKKV